MTSKKEKIKVAFVKFGGLAAGGTEKFLQQIAANLPKERFEVDYFYCDAAPYIGSDWRHPDTDATRVQYMKDHGVKCIKFHVEFKNVVVPTHDWVGTDFWEKFDENKYDIVQSGRSGHPEYPFTHIKKTVIVDSLHMPGMVDNQLNVGAVIHVSNFGKDVWVKAGGDPAKARVVYLPMEMPNPLPVDNLRDELGLRDKFVYGLHQRADDGIFSEIPLAAYQNIQDEDTAFVVLGGSSKFAEFAKMASLKNFIQLPATGDIDRVYKFLNTLDVFAHGRRDGEINSQAIAEAMAFGKPVVSHKAQANGHVETVGDAGKVVDNFKEYLNEMMNLKNNHAYWTWRSENARNRFKECYTLKTNIDKIVAIYEEVYQRIKLGDLNFGSKTTDDWLLDWMGDDENE